MIDNSFPADRVEFHDSRGVQVGCQVIGDGTRSEGDLLVGGFERAAYWAGRLDLCGSRPRVW